MENNALLTIREFCQLTKIKKTKTYELIGAGAIPAIKIGRATRISMSAVENFLKACPPVRFVNTAPQKVGTSTGGMPATGKSADLARSTRDLSQADYSPADAHVRLNGQVKSGGRNVG